MVTERELTRKQYLRSLESRTQEQIAEEEAIYFEFKRQRRSSQEVARRRVWVV